MSYTSQCTEEHLPDFLRGLALCAFPHNRSLSLKEKMCFCVLPKHFILQQHDTELATVALAPCRIHAELPKRVR